MVKKNLTSKYVQFALNHFLIEKNGETAGKKLNIVQKNVGEIKMKEISIILPNQLHENNQFLKKEFPIYLIEEYLFFKQFNFHKQKLIFHRSSMKN